MGLSGKSRLIADVRAVPDFDGNTTTWNSTSTPGVLTITGTLDGGATAPTSTPILLAKIVVSLDGSANVATSLTLDSLNITETGSGAVIPIDAPVSNTYQRGDVLQDGTTNIVDALAILQCHFGLNDYGTTPGVDCHPINGGGPVHDAGTGDFANIVDALAILQRHFGIIDPVLQIGTG